MLGLAGNVLRIGQLLDGGLLEFLQLFSQPLLHELDVLAQEVRAQVGEVLSFVAAERAGEDAGRRQHLLQPGLEVGRREVGRASRVGDQRLAQVAPEVER